MTTSVPTQISVPQPAPHTELLIPHAFANILHFSFAVSDSEFVREDTDLVMLLGNGAKIILQDFFMEETAEAMPSFIFEDLTIVPGALFLQDLGLDMSPFTTEAIGGLVQSTGWNEYESDSQELLAGIEKSGTLDDAGLMSAKGLSHNTEAAPANPYAFTRQPLLGHGPSSSTKLPSAPSGINNSGKNPEHDDPTKPPIDTGNDTITFNTPGQSLVDVHIHGDSTAAAVSPVWEGPRGHNTYTTSMGSSGWYVGGSHNFPDAWGHDSITITATGFQGSIEGGYGSDTIKLGSADADQLRVVGSATAIVGDNLTTAGVAGHDSISIKGTLHAPAATSMLVSGDAETLQNMAHGGNDTLEIHAINATDSIGNYPIVAGDARVMQQDSSGGNDIIRVQQNQNGTIVGDALTMQTGSQGGRDLIKVEKSLGGTIAGDAYNMVKAVGGNDSIEINQLLRPTSIHGDAENMLGGSGGHDRITVQNAGQATSLASVQPMGNIYGDAHFMRGQARGGNDTITIGADSLGNPLAGAGDKYLSMLVFGDSAELGDAGSGAAGGDDVISIHNTLGGATVLGDAYLMPETSQGGHDIINVHAMAAGVVTGDAHQMQQGSKAGNDQITVGNMTDGFVYGDASLMHSATAGHDDITVRSMNNGMVLGDAYTLSGNSVAGHDFIHVSSISGTGHVGGDGFELKGTAQAGNDTIFIDSMTGGFVYADAQAAAAGAIAGNDLVTIGEMHQGRIYGDWHPAYAPTNTSGGNDTIVVDLLSGTGAKHIDGGKGQDLFVYNHTDGHSLVLDGAGKVSIHDGTGKNITAETNTTIIGFEGLGGGNGNDTITGNNADNLLIGGRGNDILTGGLGADTFAWRKEDMDGSHDRITDFSLQQGDKILVQSPFDMDSETKAAVWASINDTNLTLEFWNAQTVDVNVQGSFSVNNTHYNSWSEFASQADEASINSLLQQILYWG